MGYNLNTTFFDLAELDKEGIPTISSIIVSNNNSFGLHPTIVDLKLGTSSPDIQLESEASPMDPFPSTLAGSSKRARTPTTASQPVSCLVDGCNSDLSKCRDYHRRHKVCEMHSKTPRVTIGGHVQRFCQQCSRFHSLEEFDEGKRSCRKRLEGHNRRRRKPQPETLPVNHGNFASATQGSRYFALSHQAMIPTASSVVSSNSTWCGGVKNESNHQSNPAGFYSSSSVSASSYLDAYRPRPRFPFAGSSSSAQMFHHDPNSNNGTPKLLCDGMSNQVMDTVSHRALSLLSSTPADTCQMGLGPTITRPMISELHYNNMVPYLGPQRHGLESEPGTSGSILNLRSNHSLCEDVFTGEADGSSSASGGHQTISFSWE